MPDVPLACRCHPLRRSLCSAYLCARGVCRPALSRRRISCVSAPSSTVNERLRGQSRATAAVLPPPPPRPPPLQTGNAQTVLAFVSLCTHLLVSLGLAKLGSDLISLERKQAARDEAYKREQAARNMAASAMLNATVLLIIRQTSPTPPPLTLADGARLTVSLLPPSHGPAVTLHLPDGLRAATRRFSPDDTAGLLHSWAKLELAAAGVSPLRPYELHATWARGLDGVVLRDDQALPLGSAGFVGDAELTLVWLDRTLHADGEGSMHARCQPC